MPDNVIVEPIGASDYDESRPYRRRFYSLLLFIVFFTYLHLVEDSNTYTPRKADNSVVVVTGASSGIGFELSKRLVKDGMTVFGTYRRDQDKSLLESNGILPLYMEVTQLDTITNAEKIVREYLKHEKKQFLGIISNAGILNAGPFSRVGLDLIEETLDAHLRGTVRFVRTFMDLVSSQKGGRIIVMGSLAALLLPPANAIYNSAKAGQHAFALSLRQELADLDISVSVIVCGETSGTQLHAKRKTLDVDWSGGYETFKKTFELGSKWMGESFMGTTFDDIHWVVRHALLEANTKASYYAPAFLEYLTFFTPNILIQKMMRTPPPDFLL